MSGWIKLHRKMLENPIVCKDSDHLAVWTYLLLNATHKEYLAIFSGEKITLQPGQLITGRKSISEQFNISESKVQRILKSFEIEQQIEQQTSNKNRLISILSWVDYQESEQQIEQPVNNKRTTTEQQVNTNKNVRTKELKNERNKDIKGIPPESPKGESPPKIKYADYIFLTEDEHRKLTELLGEEKRNRFFIEFASWISGQTPRVQKSRSAYLTILNWHNREGKSKKGYDGKKIYQSSGFSTKPKLEVVRSKRETSLPDHELAEMINLAREMDGKPPLEGEELRAAINSTRQAQKNNGA